MKEKLCAGDFRQVYKLHCQKLKSVEKMKTRNHNELLNSHQVRERAVRMRGFSLYFPYLRSMWCWPFCPARLEKWWRPHWEIGKTSVSQTDFTRAGRIITKSLDHFRRESRSIGWNFLMKTIGSERNGLNGFTINFKSHKSCRKILILAKFLAEVLQYL